MGIIKYFREFKFKSAYFKMVFVFTAVLIVTVTLSVFVMFHFLKNLSKDKSDTIYENSYQYTVDVIELTYDKVRTLANGILSNPILLTEYEDLSLAEKQGLSGALFSNFYEIDSVDSIYVYYPKSDMVVSSNRGTNRLGIFSDNEWYSAFFHGGGENNGNFPFLIIARNVNNSDMMTYIQKSKTGIKGFEPVLVININKDKLFRIIENLPGGQFITVLDSVHGILYDKAGIADLVLPLLKSGEHFTGSDKRSVNVQNKEYEISYVAVNGGFCYLSAVETDYINLETGNILLFTIIVSIAAIFLSVLVWMLYSFRIYRPIIDIFTRLSSVKKNSFQFSSEMKMMQSITQDVIKINEDYESLKVKGYNKLVRSLAISLCTGEYSSEEEIFNDIHEVGFDIENAQYHVIILELIAPDNLSIEGLQKAYGNIKLSVYNIISSFYNKAAMLQTFVDYLRFVVILAVNDDGFDVSQAAADISEDLIEKYGVDVVFGIGKPAGSIQQIPISYIEAIESLSLQKCMIDEIDTGGSLKDTRDELIQAAKKYIEENFSEEMSLSTIADKYYINSTYLSTKFKKETGVGLSEYIKNVRMKKAAEFLLNTNKTVDRIAVDVGYENKRSFLRVFRNEIGMTPTEYRKKHAYNAD